MKPLVSDVRLARPSARDRDAGLLGFVSFLLDGMIRIDGVTVRRTADGRQALSFPARRDRDGRDHPYLRPVDDRTRRAIEAQVFASLGLGVVGAG